MNFNSLPKSILFICFIALSASIISTQVIKCNPVISSKKITLKSQYTPQKYLPVCTQSSFKVVGKSYTLATGYNISKSNVVNQSSSGSQSQLQQMLGNLGGLLGGTTAGQGIVIQTPVLAGSIPSNASNPQVIFTTPQQIKEGYYLISNYQQNEVAVNVWKYLLLKYTTILQTATIVRVLRQDIPQVSYQFVVQFSYTKTIKLTYVFTVSVTVNKIFVITNGQFVDLWDFQSNKLRKITDRSVFSFFSQMEALIKTEYAKDFQNNQTLSEVWADQPYFVLVYTNCKATTFKITFIFDLITVSIKTIKVERISSQQPVTTPKPVVIVPIAPVAPSTPVTPKPQVSVPTPVVVQPTVPVTQPIVIPKPIVTQPTPVVVQPTVPVTQPIVITKPIVTQPTPIVTQPTNPITSTPIAQQPVPVVQESTIDSEDSIDKSDDSNTKSEESTEKSEESNEPKPSQPEEIVQPQETTPIQTQPINPQEPMKPTLPTFDFSFNHQLLMSQLQSISDPALIPFLTESFIQDLDQQKLSTLIQYIIVKAHISQSFTVILVNQIRYGVRIVIQLNGTNELYQSVITFIYKNRDKSTSEIELVSWRRIDSILDIDPDVFTKYYALEAEYITSHLTDLILKAFKTQQALAKFEKIEQVEKKPSFDGIYYRILIQTVNGLKYQFIFFWVPETDYLEVLKYELLQNGYNASSEVRITAIPDDKFFNASQKFLSTSFGAILSSSKMEFTAIFETTQIKYIRFVFVSVTGKYEIILSINIKTMTVNVVRWEKVEDGYVALDISKIKTDDNFKQAVLTAKGFCSGKLNIQAEPSYAEYKVVPGYSQYFKLLFTQPFPFIITVDYRDEDKVFAIRGISRIQITPTSQYYNDRIFAGYRSISIIQLQYDKTYQIFLKQLSSSTNSTIIIPADSQVLAAFRLVNPLGIYYKVIYNVIGRLYLVTFFYEFSSGKYSIFSIQNYERKIQAGDYRWKCSSNDPTSKACTKCQSNLFLLTSGRCYNVLTGCDLQIASTCISCSSGFLRIGSNCNQNPSLAISESSSTPTTIKQQVVTVTGTQTIVYEYAVNDGSICLKYNGTICTLCAYRFFLANGVCAKVQDECEIYTSLGICQKCYSGFYNSTKGCLPMNPLCLSANSLGQCTKCYSNYTLENGKCSLTTKSSKTETSTDGKTTTTTTTTIYTQTIPTYYTQTVPTTTTYYTSTAPTTTYYSNSIGNNINQLVNEHVGSI